VGYISLSPRWGLFCVILIYRHFEQYYVISVYRHFDLCLVISAYRHFELYCAILIYRHFKLYWAISVCRHFKLYCTISIYRHFEIYWVISVCGIKVEKDTMGKKKLVNDCFWISYILFFGVCLTKYQNLRIGLQAYFKNIPWKSYPPLKSKKCHFFHFSVVIKMPKKIEYNFFLIIWV
jgi:hypothetical protein